MYAQYILYIKYFRDQIQQTILEHMTYMYIKRLQNNRCYFIVEKHTKYQFWEKKALTMLKIYPLNTILLQKTENVMISKN